MKKPWAGLILVTAIGLVGCFQRPPGTAIPFHAEGAGDWLTFADSVAGTDGSTTGTTLGEGNFGGNYEIRGDLQPCAAGAAWITLNIDLSGEDSSILHQEWFGSICESDPDPNILLMNGTFNDLGGTRRFRDATGSGHVDAQFRRGSDTFSFIQDGTICCLKD